MCVCEWRSCCIGCLLLKLFDVETEVDVCQVGLGPGQTRIYVELKHTILEGAYILCGLTRPLGLGLILVRHFVSVSVGFVLLHLIRIMLPPLPEEDGRPQSLRPSPSPIPTAGASSSFIQGFRNGDRFRLALLYRDRLRIQGERSH